MFKQDHDLRLKVNWKSMDSVHITGDKGISPGQKSIDRVRHLSKICFTILKMVGRNDLADEQYLSSILCSIHKMS